MDYREAGVNIEAGRSFVEQIRQQVESTHRPGVIGGLGGFGGYFEIPGGYREPVLVSGVDGVGTKLKIAQQLDRHHTIGIDLVAMCVNDILSSGAEPLFFLDYLATGKLKEQELADVVKGIVAGCKSSNCALIGGETAEMPGFYQSGEYDLAGFCVGIVEKSKLLDGSQVEVGNMVLGLASNGVHSNGYSLVRKIVSDRGLNWLDRPEFFAGQSLGEVFLAPTRIYVKPILEALRSGMEIRGMAHITGGGIPENLPRCLGQGQSIQIDRNSWEIPPVFQWLQENGNVSDKAMWDTFNMGIGLAIIVPAKELESSLKWFATRDIAAYKIGEVIEGNSEILGIE
ncbi:MAG: phosphoribosylformylglycinamidine cyclo-ligase [Prochloraceae cyanobacterium]|nr:phosphoribosylformylglycinamidine cyclo-ligase [Prochloraceae cyanobacterium]